MLKLKDKCLKTLEHERQIPMKYAIPFLQKGTPVLFARDYVSKDSVMRMLSDQISNGFPPEKKLLRIELREFWQHREVLSKVDGVPLIKNSVIVPQSLRDEVLETLHSAHQGTTGMHERETSSVWWPGITPQIKERREKCKNCNEHTPSQPSAPPLPLPQNTSRSKGTVILS